MSLFKLSQYHRPIDPCDSMRRQGKLTGTTHLSSAFLLYFNEKYHSTTTGSEIFFSS